MSTPDGGISAISPAVTAATTMTRRVPPPCWTEDETLSLVNAYKERWFALRRGNLRAADWDAVAVAVSSTGGETSAKSAIQCRHKIEKLRKRFRAEKQRFLNKPGKFSSSWDLFPVLDAMEFAPTPIFGSSYRRFDCDDDDDEEKSCGFDRFVLKSRKVGSFEGDSDSNLGFGHAFGVTVDDRSREKDYGGFAAGHDFDQGFRVGYGLKRRYNGELRSSPDVNHNSGGGFGVRLEDEMAPMLKGIRLKTSGKTDDRHRSVADFGHSVGGFPVKTLGDRNLVPPRFRPKNYGRLNGTFSSSLDYDDGIDDRADRGDGFVKKIPCNWDSVPIGIRTKGYGKTDESFGFSSNTDFGSSSGLRSSSGSSPNRDSHVIEGVVSSVKLLAEMFVRMETSKMEMAREIEKTRMEMELKHCQMMLETQQQIVEAFAEVIMEKKSKKKIAKVDISPSIKVDRDEAELR